MRKLILGLCVLAGLLSACKSHEELGDEAYQRKDWDQAAVEYHLAIAEERGDTAAVKIVSVKRDVAQFEACRIHIGKARTALIKGDAAAASDELNMAETLRLAQDEKAKADIADLTSKIWAAKK